MSDRTSLFGFFFVPVLFMLTVSSSVWAQEDLLESIDRAVAGEFFSKALELIDQGKASYPEDPRFAREEGDLYSDRKLYNLALEAYREVERLNPENREIRKEIASILGFLDRNEEALVYLEELVTEEYDSYLIDDLGWMYFKTHQAGKGIPLLEEALSKEFRKSLALTLGTLYSEENNQDLCRKYYLEAIESALKSGDHYFASVAYYNLSIAEQSFYSYEKAIEYARLSLQEMERSGGHLALGDLFLTKGDYAEAEKQIKAAAALDETPLSAMSLASFQRQRGRLDAALFQVEALEKNRDDSWMYYYGIDSRRFETDMIELKKEIYKGKFHQERLTARAGISGKIRRLGRLARYFVLSRYYDSLFRIQTFRVGKVQWERSSRLRGALTLASAAEGFPATAGKYWLRAMILEKDEPLSVPWYDLELGRERRDADLLYRSLVSFQKEWEASMVEESYRQMLLEKMPENVSAVEAASAVYRSNSGGLKQYGLALPVSIRFSGFHSAALERKITRTLGRQGIKVLKSYTGYEPVLRLHQGENGVLDYVVSFPDGTQAASGVVEPSGRLRSQAYQISRSIEESLFP